MLTRLWRKMREVVAGRRLSHAIQQHDRAADDLDALLREVLKR